MTNPASEDSRASEGDRSNENSLTNPKHQCRIARLCFEKGAASESKNQRIRADRDEITQQSRKGEFFVIERSIVSACGQFQCLLLIMSLLWFDRNMILVRLQNSHFEFQATTKRKEGTHMFSRYGCRPEAHNARCNRYRVGIRHKPFQKYCTRLE